MHRARELLVRQRTMLANALRGHLAEFGLITAQGLHKLAAEGDVRPRAAIRCGWPVRHRPMLPCSTW